MSDAQFRRGALAISFGPAYRQAALQYYGLDDPRRWHDLPPLERERWVELGHIALMVNKRLVEAMDSPTPARASVTTGAQTAGGVVPGAAGGDTAQSKPGIFVSNTSESQFSPLRRYQSPLERGK